MEFEIDKFSIGMILHVGDGVDRRYGRAECN